MHKRTLIACLAALGAWLVFDLITRFSGIPLDLPVQTPVGWISIGGLLVTFAAMAWGGWIAQRGFGWIALALTALVWLAAIATLWATAQPASATSSLPGILEYHAVAIALSLAAAWAGALVGERLAARRTMPQPG